MDVSKGIEKLEVPVGKVDFAMGDVHIYGNPHFWLDPENGEIIAREIKDKFTELLPQDKDYFEKNYNEFIAQLNTSIKKWEEELKPLAGLKVVTYHDSLTYFAKRFGINVIGQIELRPAIPPTPSHVLELEEKMKTEGVKLILIEPYYNIDAANEIAKSTGAKVCIFSDAVGGMPGINSYIGLFDYDIAKIIDAMK